MAGARIQVTLNDGAFLASIARIGGVLRTGIVRSIGVALLTETERRFVTGKDPFGKPWKGLLPAYAAIKKNRHILVESGRLVKSLTMATSGSRITIGSNMPYAGVHQFGATIKPVRAKALAFRLGASGPRGGKSSGIVRAKSVTIPARPYLGFGPTDQRAAMETLDLQIRRAIGG